MIRVLATLAVIGCASAPRTPRIHDPVVSADRTFELARSLDYRAPILREARSRDRAAMLYLAACREGNARSCWLGLVIADAADAARPLAIATGRNCLAGDEPSCRALAGDLRLRLGDRDAHALCAAGLAAACSTVDRRPFLQRGCDLGDAASCFALRSLDRDRTTAVVEFRQARALDRAIAECVRGFPHSCVLISQLDPSAAARWLPQLRTEAGIGCRAGLLDECALLARLSSEPLLANPRVEGFAATQLCRTRGTHCELLVALHQPSGRLPDPIALRDALEHHCQLGRDRASCSRLAAAYLSQQLPEPIRGRGRQLASFLETAKDSAQPVSPAAEHGHQ